MSLFDWRGITRFTSSLSLMISVGGHPGRDHDTHPGVSPHKSPIFTFTRKVLTETEAKNWLMGPREIFCRSHLLTYCRTSGIPPEAEPGRPQDLLYRGFGFLSSSNFHVLLSPSQHFFSLVTPEAKQRDKLMYDAFWALAQNHFSRPCAYISPPWCNPTCQN